MTNSLVSYQFETDPVRVVTCDGEPWFVASDLAKALGYRDAANMVRNLHDDEKGTHIVSTLKGDQTLNIVSESGMYAVVFKSRRAEAERFRRWVTAEVLPAIRRTGRYELPDPHVPRPVLLTIDTPRLNAYVGMLREARRLHGAETARILWQQLGLPVASGDGAAAGITDRMATELAAWLAERDSCTLHEAWSAVGEGNESVGGRLRELMRGWGWVPMQAKGKRGTQHIWYAPYAEPRR